jgi:hypothetical protein
LRACAREEKGNGEAPDGPAEEGNADRLFEPEIARSKPGPTPSSTKERFQSWLWDKLSSFL